ncbi:MAG: 2-oxoglutarate dehydrogenase complex dihydrolipoyllysine-residue succinyltransferase [Kyrpidia sp.]|nr:2-oxoglutarate dehydrogenase complex dihydrolipoyllysine-residue succinyltransferase [Kyrpidia sp.]
MSDIKVPELGESIVEATILNWLKKEGDPVTKGEAVAELETDKVNVEVAAEEDGVLESIVKQAGETVKVGETIARVAAGATPGAGNAAATLASSAEQPGQTAPSASPEQAAPPSPTAPSASAARQAATAETGTAPERPAQPAHPAGPPSRPQQPPRATTPSQRRKALAQGTAPVEGAATVSKEAPSPAAVTPPPATRTPSAPPGAASSAARTAQDANGDLGRADEERIPMTRRRLTIARRLVEAKQATAMLTTFNEIDMSAVLDIRRRRRERFQEQHGVGLGFMSFFTKAAVGALKAFPLLNAEIRGTDIVVKHHYDIGIAVATPAGLVVPVVRDVDRLSFAEIEKRIADLAGRARTGALHPQELQGGTFTITNGGVFGSLFSTPILNPPQVGILGMHAIKERPVAADGQIVLRPMMYVALSYDHRIVDGAEAVQFLVKVKELIEDPESLLLEG